MSRVFNYESLVHATAGATGSIFAMTCIYPLDNVKFRMQLQDASLLDKTTLEALIYILKKEGVGALYRGLTSELTTLGISSFIYFYAFHGLKTLLTEKKLSAKTDLVISIAAGIINICFTSPLMVVNNRLKSSSRTFSGLSDGLLHVVRNEGIGALWSGFSSSLILVSNPAIHFTIYEALKRRSTSKSAFDSFTRGAISKALATIITYPIQLAQTHQRFRKKYNMNTMLLLWLMIKKGGVPALYRGLEAKLIQTVLHAALMFMVYEKIIMYSLLLYKKPVVK